MSREQVIEMALLTGEETLKAINKYPTHALDNRWRISDREQEMCIRVMEAQLNKLLDLRYDCTDCGGDGLDTVDCRCHGGGMATKSCSPCFTCNGTGESKNRVIWILAENQELPNAIQHKHFIESDYTLAQQDMIKDGWVKIKFSDYLKEKLK